MTRNKNFKSISIKEDPIYKSTIIHKFINGIMRHGLKSKAFSIVKFVFAKLEKNLKKSSIEIFLECLNKVKPDFFLRKKRIASSSYSIPVPISVERGNKIGIKWIISSSKKRTERTLKEKIYHELFDIYKDNKSNSIKLKESVNKIAEQNKAFIHYI